MPVGGYHMRLDLPDDATKEEIDKARAASFQHALTHAATDPTMRQEMILGETRSEWRAFVTSLAAKLAAEPEATREAVIHAFIPEMRNVWETFFPLKQIESSDVG